jgi:hypothetical protein
MRVGGASDNGRGDFVALREKMGVGSREKLSSGRISGATRKTASGSEEGRQRCGEGFVEGGGKSSHSSEDWRGIYNPLAIQH